MIVYFNGAYLPKSEVRISPDDRGFIFADGVYDVIRSYRGHLFTCAEHLKRLAHGLEELRIEGVDALGLEAVAMRLLRDNQLQDAEATVYVQVTRGAAPRTHKFPVPAATPTVYVEAKVFSPPLAERKNGAAAILVPDDRWGRCDLKTTNLLPNVLAIQRAKDAGAFEAILHRDGLLQEGTHSSILYVIKNQLICPPLTNRLLPSVTRQVVISLALAESIKMDIRAVRVDDIWECDEILMVGTGSEIIPITKVNGRVVRDGKVGPVAGKLQRAFEELVRSRR